VLVGATGISKTQFVLQIGLHAALRGVPTLYIGLELDDPQVVARLAGIQSGVHWSALFNGFLPHDVQRAAFHAARKMEGLPFYVEEPAPQGWPLGWIRDAAAELRRRHPDLVDPLGQPLRGSRPALMILDFLQIVGDDANGRGDPRERIGKAAYAARHVAREFDVAVLIVSSAARNAYKLLHSGLDTAGLAAWTDHKGVVQTRINHPDQLVGCGKESGEIEYAADSVSVLARPRDDQLLLAVPKLRAGPNGWWLMQFDGSLLREATDAQVIGFANAQREERTNRKKTKKNVEHPSVEAKVSAMELT
jgi:hypothetical protein